MIYLKDKKVYPYYGDYNPLSIYQGSKKIAGWVEKTSDISSNIRIENGYSTMKVKPFGKSEQVQTEQGKNLLPFKDINFTLKGVNFYTENGNLYLNGASTGEILTNDNAYITYFSFILPVGTYKFKHFSSLNVNMAIQLKNVSDKSELASINLNSNTVKTFTLDKETEVYLGIYIYNQNFNSENLKLMLSIENATEYEPFVPDSPSPDYPSPIENVSGDLEVKAIAKNLFNINDENIGKVNCSEVLIEGNSITITSINSATTSRVDFPVNYPVNKPLEISFNATIISQDLLSENVVRIYFRKDSQTYGAIELTKNNLKNHYSSKINAIPEKDIKLWLYVKSVAKQGTIKVKFQNIQIEVGETATEFEEYKEQTVTFPFAEGQKLMKDGYLGENGIVNKRKQIVLTGTENWSKRTNKNNSFNLYIDEKSMSGISTHYLPFIASNEIDTQNGIYLLNTLAIIITDLRFTTVEEFKTWLAEQYANGTPVIVEYEIEEETTPYTEEQQTAYNNLQKLKTYRTVTNISNNQDTNMKIMYKINN